jgi:prevent-host-death family protein
MKTVNIHEAKTHLSRLLDEVENGEPFVIAKAGKPKAMVTRFDPTPSRGKRRLGGLEGLYTLPENFEQIDREMDKEIEELFLGKNGE